MELVTKSQLQALVILTGIVLLFVHFTPGVMVDADFGLARFRIERGGKR